MTAAEHGQTQGRSHHYYQKNSCLGTTILPWRLFSQETTFALAPQADAMKADGRSCLPAAVSGASP
ncbi:MAG: hypothetical protein Q4D74_05740 [Comamonadaceae bacterium]|nr:hypothetical protein [Comamonadaceae bacterium]